MGAHAPYVAFLVFGCIVMALMGLMAALEWLRDR